MPIAFSSLFSFSRLFPNTNALSGPVADLSSAKAASAPAWNAQLANAKGPTCRRTRSTLRGATAPISSIVAVRGKKRTLSETKGPKAQGPSRERTLKLAERSWETWSLGRKAPGR